VSLGENINGGRYFTQFMVINAIKSIVINSGHGYAAYFGETAFIRASGDRQTVVT